MPGRPLWVVVLWALLPANTLCPQSFILCALEAQQSPRCGYIYVSICHRLQLQPRLRLWQRLRLRHRIRIWIRCLPACLFLGLPQSPPLLPLLFIFSSERRFCFASTIDCQLPCAYTSCSFLLSFLCSARFVFVLPVSLSLCLCLCLSTLSVRPFVCPPRCLPACLPWLVLSWVIYFLLPHNIVPISTNTTFYHKIIIISDANANAWAQPGHRPGPATRPLAVHITHSGTDAAK